MKKALFLLLLVSVVACLLSGCCLSHEWVDATCTEPMTCSKCGKTQGEPLGHTWIDATCTKPKTCTVCGAEEGEPLEHTWADATCTEAKTCTVCGTEEGKPLGHQCPSATCTEASVCSVCGETVEAALGHDWMAATEETPKTCRRCGTTEGEPLGPQDYEMTPDQYISKFNSLNASSSISLSPNKSKDRCAVVLSGQDSGMQVQFCNMRKGLSGATTGAGLSNTGFDTVYAYFMSDDSYADSDTLTTLTMIGIAMAKPLGWEIDVDDLVDAYSDSKSSNRFSYRENGNVLVVEYRTTSYSSVYDVYVSKYY